MTIALGTVSGSGKNLAVDTTADYSIQVTVPTDVVNDDYMLGYFGIRGATGAVANFDTPSGWTLIDSVTTVTSTRPVYALYYRKASSEPENYTFTAQATSGTLNQGQAMVVRVTGAHATTFQDATATTSAGSAASPASPTITTVTNDAAVVSFWVSSDGRHVSLQDGNAPSGDTVVYLRSSGLSSSGNSMAISYNVQAAAGASGARTWTGALTTSNNYSAITIAIRPAAVAAGTTNITDVSDTTIYHGQTGIVVTGTNFNAAQGDGEIYICSADDPDHASATNQTVTAWSDTSITFTAVLSSFNFDDDLYLFIRNSDEEEDTTGFVIQRRAVISITKTLETKAGAAQASVTDINWAVYEDVTLETLLERGTGESTNGSGSLVINLTEQGGLDPNASDPVYLVLSKDGAVGSELFGAVKVVPTYA